jgi:hypothetical protein
LYEVWLKLACWFWIRFLKIFSEFLLFRYYLPLGKGVVLHLYNSEFPLPKDDLWQVWLKLAQRFWRSRKCKSLQTDVRRTDRQTTDKERSEKLTWAFSSGELKIVCSSEKSVRSQTVQRLFTVQYMHTSGSVRYWPILIPSPQGAWKLENSHNS